MANLGGFSRQNFVCFTTRGVTQPPRDCSAVQGGAIPAGQMELDGAGGSDLPSLSHQHRSTPAALPHETKPAVGLPRAGSQAGSQAARAAQVMSGRPAWLLHPPKYAQRKTAMGGENTTQDI